MKARIWNYSGWVDETNADILKKTYHEILMQSGFSILDFIDYHFQPIGWTGLWMLGESHFAIHTFPEENKSYIELSSCNFGFYKDFINFLK